MEHVEYVQRVLTSRVYDVAVETPLVRASQLSARLGGEVLLKREDLQPIYSFKLRGAYNRIAHLSPEERAAGIVTASAGNHAQGVAYSAAKLGLRALIVMPVTTPDIKVRAVRARGGEVVLHGDSYSDAEAHAWGLQRECGFTFVHPYDDPLVIAGQGTVGLEILRQAPRRGLTVFVPVGGGGLIAGVAVFLKSLDPSIRVIGVEPIDSDAMCRSIEAGERVTLSQVGIFVDGVAVKRVGEHTFALARRYVDGWVRVDTDEVCAAIKDVFDDTRAVLEPAGALAVAGLKRWAREHEVQGASLVAITSGANLNFDRLRHVAERAEVGEQREAIFAVTIPERPGAFKAFCQQLGRHAVTEFNYRYAPGESAHVFVGVQLDRPEQRETIAGTLRSLGYPVLDLTSSELAKVHLRHMVGGRSPAAVHERLHSFEFPERPGALLQFLQAFSERWNISLFHYRNHGAAHGRVLCGLQVPPEDLEPFERSLEQLGYPHRDESTDPAFRLFLG
jgi:threonine dehydratase